AATGSVTPSEPRPARSRLPSRDRLGHAFRAATGSVTPSEPRPARSRLPSRSRLGHAFRAATVRERLNRSPHDRRLVERQPQAFQRRADDWVAPHLDLVSILHAHALVQDFLLQTAPDVVAFLQPFAHRRLNSALRYKHMKIVQ